MTLAEAHDALMVGDTRVCYRPRLGHREYGTMTSLNARWVFVRYDGDNGAKATDPEQLYPAPDGGVRHAG
jgi:hypothetical protein